MRHAVRGMLRGDLYATRRMTHAIFRLL